MAQYINKSALVAVIKKRIKTLDEILSKRPISWPTLEKLIEENKKVLSFLNTLEVKEVDLEKECAKYFEENDLCVHDDYIKFAIHFFELGLKAQKGE